MALSNSEVVKKYVSDRYHTGKSSSVFFEGDIIYSYGYHFPLAVRLENSGHYLLNGDRYSSSTANHQSIVRKNIPERRRVIIPFSALSSIIPAHPLCDYARKNLTVVDITSDFYTHRDVFNNETNEYETVAIHHLGASVIKIGESFYLSGMDETGRGFGGMYHITKLYEEASTVAEAMELLKPEQIIGLSEGEYIRQGEWFFVPCPDVDIPKEIVVSKYALPNRGRDQADWNHIATRGTFFWGNHYVKGTVRHPQHKMVNFTDKKIWHKAYEARGAGENGEVISWASGGNVD